jgi:hypothetical protein
VTTPSKLRASVEADLRPVRPLARPVLRAGWVAPIACAVLAAAPLAFGIRRDAAQLGWVLTWGASAFEMLLGLGLVTAALREAVPATMLSRRALGVAFCAAGAAISAITWLTWSTSAIQLVHDPRAIVWRICVAGIVVSAAPPLFAAAWLTARAFPLRPAVAGSLYGLGAGLMADAGWRIFCHFSNPAHVFGAHTAAVAVATAAGAVIARRLAPMRAGDS